MVEVKNGADLHNLIELKDLTEHIKDGTNLKLEDEKGPPDSDQIIPQDTKFNIEDLKKGLEGLRCEGKYLQFIEEAEAVIDHKCKLLTGVIPPGFGKTSIIRSIFNSRNKLEGRDYIIQSGYISPLMLHELLSKFKMSNQTIVFDDCDEVFNDPISTNLLKAAANTSSVRRVSYSSKGNRNSQNAFNFEASIIIITNKKLGKKNRALQDRGFFIEFNLTPSEKIEYIEKFLVNFNYDGTTPNERMCVFNDLKFLVENNGLYNFSCRTFEQLIERRVNVSEKAYKAALSRLASEKLTPLEQLIQIMHENIGNPKIWLPAYRELAGRSKRDYQYKLKMAKEELGDEKFIKLKKGNQSTQAKEI